MQQLVENIESCAGTCHDTVAVYSFAIKCIPIFLQVGFEMKLLNHKWKCQNMLMSS